MRIGIFELNDFHADGTIYSDNESKAENLRPKSLAIAADGTLIIGGSHAASGSF